MNTHRDPVTHRDPNVTGSPRDPVTLSFRRVTVTVPRAHTPGVTRDPLRVIRCWGWQSWR